MPANERKCLLIVIFVVESCFEQCLYIAYICRVRVATLPYSLISVNFDDHMSQTDFRSSQSCGYRTHKFRQIRQIREDTDTQYSWL